MGILSEEAIITLRINSAGIIRSVSGALQGGKSVRLTVWWGYWKVRVSACEEFSQCLPCKSGIDSGCANRHMPTSVVGVTPLK